MEDFTVDDIVAKDKLKRARSLVGTSEGRPDGDYYPTPSDAVQALLDREKFTGSIWENSCGDGSICHVLTANGYTDVLATDLVYRGYGEGDHDFLTSELTADNVVMNPPFSLAQEFIEKSLAVTTGKVAMLGKLQFLESGRRKIMFESTPLKTVYVFSKRVTMTRDGKKMKNSGMIAFAWFVWEHGYEGKPTIEWI